MVYQSYANVPRLVVLFSQDVIREELLTVIIFKHQFLLAGPFVFIFILRKIFRRFADRELRIGINSVALVDFL